MTPLLYSFRRCPYAIRARMALAYSDIRVELREVKLSDMPAAMLQLSPKATVPVLALPDGRVIDQSLEVMHWSLGIADPEHWLEMDSTAQALIRHNDDVFKALLDRYKYADRYPQFSRDEHRRRAQDFIAQLDRLLGRNRYLNGAHCRLCDIAILPFVRQFAGVDPGWFEQCEYGHLRDWLQQLLSSPGFLQVMSKHPFWQPGDAAVYL